MTSSDFPMRLRALCIAATAVALAACETDEGDGPLEPTGAFGRVRFVNTVPDAAVGAMNASLEGVPFAAGLAVGAATPYQPVYTGERALVVRRTADTAAVLLNAPFTVTDGGAYTVVAAGRTASVTPVVLTDSVSIGATDSARVRIAHFSPSGGAVDVYLTSTTASIATAAPTVAALPYQSAARYLRVPNGRLRIRVTPAGSKTVAADDTTNVFASGQIRTVLVLDRVGGGAPPRVVTLTDR
jgi:hypothetical protein